MSDTTRKRTGGPELPVVGTRKNPRGPNNDHPIAAHMEDESDEEEFNPIAVSGQAIVEEPEEAKRNLPDDEDRLREGMSLAEIIRRPVMVRGATTQDRGAETLEQPAGEARRNLPVVRAAAPARARVEPVATLDTDPAMGLYTDDPYALQVKIGPDGRIILDQASTQIAQPEVPEGPQRIIIEGGRTHITSATYAKRARSEKWKGEEVELLYDALSMCGTDFSLIEVFYPTRTRAHVKARFKKEEKEHPERINQALRNKRPIDVEYFKELIAIKKAVQAGAEPPAGVASATRPLPPPPPTQVAMEIEADPSYNNEDNEMADATPSARQRPKRTAAIRGRQMAAASGDMEAEMEAKTVAAGAAAHRNGEAGGDGEKTTGQAGEMEADLDSHPGTTSTNATANPNTTTSPTKRATRTTSSAKKAATSPMHKQKAPEKNAHVPTPTAPPYYPSDLPPTTTAPPDSPDEEEGMGPAATATAPPSTPPEPEEPIPAATTAAAPPGTPDADDLGPATTATAPPDTPDGT